MVTEYIKRGQKMGFDIEGTLVYKVLATEPAPEPAPVEVEEEEDEEEQVSFGLFKK